MDPSPPTSPSRPPDVIHVIGFPRPSPFFALPLPCIILHENRRTKNGGGLGTRHYFCFAMMFTAHLSKELKLQGYYFLYTLGIIPNEVMFSCLHTTVASSLPNPLSHTVPQNPPIQISTLPSLSLSPPTRRRSLELHSGREVVFPWQITLATAPLNKLSTCFYTYCNSWLICWVYQLSSEHTGYTHDSHESNKKKWSSCWVYTAGVTALYPYIPNPEPVLWHCLSQSMQWIRELPLNVYVNFFYIIIWCIMLVPVQ